MPDDPPRLLASGTGARYRTLPNGRQAVDDRQRDTDHGYTTNPARALAGAGEALTVDQLDDLQIKADRLARDRRVAEWHDRRAAIEKQLAWVHSQRMRRDVSSTVRALQRQLDRLDERIAKP